MKIKLTRAIIYPKDVQRITGKSERYGRLLLAKIKNQLSKQQHQYISIEEFCTYTGLSPETVCAYIHD
jgi:Fic family protein